MTTTAPAPEASTDAQPPEMGPRELARWMWRQLTSMRTALILLLLLALAAVPGSLIPQNSVDNIKADQWRTAHKTLTPIYEKIGLFSVYSAPWFAAIYLLLMISLIGCIIPRLGVYWRGMRAQPPATPRHLTRMPDSVSYVTDEDPHQVLTRARRQLMGYRLRTGQTDSVSAEKGFLREAGNLLFHSSLIIVLVAFATGSLFGYKGGVIVMVGKDYGFANEMTQYDEFKPGSLFSPDRLDDFHFDVDSFSAQWLTSGPKAGLAKGFQSHLTYTKGDEKPKTYDLKVNHPLTIGGTEVFLIGHGYAPDVTVRDGKGNVAASGPIVFLPQTNDLTSFGVIKAPDASPSQLGFQGLFYPFEAMVGGQPANLTGDIGDGKHALLSLQGFQGDLNLSAGPQSVYTLDTSKAHLMTAPGGKAFNLRVGQTVQLPNGLGSITFNGVEQWNRLQISKQPGKDWALVGVSLALLGLLGSLFIRPRRVWVRARRVDGATLVEVAALDRSGGGDITEFVDKFVTTLRGFDDEAEPSDQQDVQHQQDQKEKS